MHKLRRPERNSRYQTLAHIRQLVQYSLPIQLHASFAAAAFFIVGILSPNDWFAAVIKSYTELPDFARNRRIEETSYDQSSIRIIEQHCRISKSCLSTLDERLNWIKAESDRLCCIGSGSERFGLRLDRLTVAWYSGRFEVQDEVIAVQGWSE